MLIVVSAQAGAPIATATKAAAPSRPVRTNSDVLILVPPMSGQWLDACGLGVPDGVGWVGLVCVGVGWVGLGVGFRDAQKPGTACGLPAALTNAWNAGLCRALPRSLSTRLVKASHRPTRDGDGDPTGVGWVEGPSGWADGSLWPGSGMCPGWLVVATAGCEACWAWLAAAMGRTPAPAATATLPMPRIAMITAALTVRIFATIGVRIRVLPGSIDRLSRAVRSATTASRSPRSSVPGSVLGTAAASSVASRSPMSGVRLATSASNCSEVLVLSRWRWVLISTPVSAGRPRTVTQPVEVLPEAAQSPVGGGAHGAGAFAQHSGRGRGAEAHHDPQQHRLGLVSGQRRDQRHGVFGVDGHKRQLCGVVPGGDAGKHVVRYGPDGVAPGGPQVVQGTV